MMRFTGFCEKSKNLDYIFNSNTVGKLLKLPKEFKITLKIGKANCDVKNKLKTINLS